MDKYLFGISMHNCGSTAMAYILWKCQNVFMMREVEGVSYFKGRPNLGPHDEDWKLPRLFSERLDVVANRDKYNWDNIKQEWHKQWTKFSTKKPKTSPVFFEKSPVTGIWVADQLKAHFSPAYFFSIVRNPYLVVEGIHRRRHNGYTLHRIATHVCKCLEKQLDLLLDTPTSNYVHFKYEDMCKKPDEIGKAFVDMMPELSDINMRQQNIGGQWGPLQNKNVHYSRNINDEFIGKVNAVFNEYETVIRTAGYLLYQDKKELMNEISNS